MADPKVQRNIRDYDADDRRSRGSRQAAPDPQQNGAMEFPRALGRSRPASCARSDQGSGTRRRQSSQYARSSSQGETRVEDNEGSIDPELGQEETTMFRAVAAKLNYLSQDRPDITLATMKLCSKMSRPDAQDLKNMKRVGRFLVGRPRVGCLFEWQAHPSALHALADADWAGDRQSRKSVSGSMILHGKHLIKAWTKQQSIVAASTAEAELYAGNRAATESMGVQAFAKDLGRVVPIRLHIDSSAALSMISSRGLGKAKHIEIQYLWLQEAVRNNKLTVEKILSETNSSDLGTKHLTSERSEMLMKLVNCFYV